MTDQPELSRLSVIFKAALNDYEKQTDITLEKHPLAEQLQHCCTVESVAGFLQNQVRSCSRSRGTDRIMESLNGTVSVLHSLSASFDNLGTPFPLVKTIYAGLAVLLATVKDVRTLNLLVDLLELIELLLKPLDIYTKIPPTTVVTGVVVKTLVELLSILALATSLIKQERLEIFTKKHSVREYVEMAVERLELDRLTLEEARTIAVPILGVIHGLVQHIKVIMEDGKPSIDRVRDAQIMHYVVSDANKSKRDELQQNVRSWLSPPDPSINHKLACESRHTGTAAWFLQGDIFSEWILSERNSLLWIYGKSGAGKSVLCSAIIQSVDIMRRAGLASVAYFYCDFRDDKKKDLGGLLSSLLVQLCPQSDFYFDAVYSLYKEQITGLHYPSDDALRLCLKKILKFSGQAPVYLILDALDECPIASQLPSPRDKMLMLVKELMTSQFPNIRICVTSRPDADVRAVLEPLSFCFISLHDESGHREDIAHYIKSVVNTDPNMRKWRTTDKEPVINVLTHKVDGIFQWASCQLAYLRHCPRKRIQRTLDDLPETLDGTYLRTLRDIDEADRALAYCLFSCVSVARRPLRAEELAELLAFNFKAGPLRLFRRSWRREDLVNAVQTTYSSLLAIIEDRYTTIIQFSHFSVQEFFENRMIANASAGVSYRHVHMAPTHTLVAQACLDALLRLYKKNVIRDRLHRYPLAEYAAEHWPDHARFGNVWQNVEDKVKRLFDPRQSHLAACIWIHDPEFTRRVRTERGARCLSSLPPAGTPLHYAALRDLQTIVEFLVVECSQNVHAQGFTNMVTPLHLAAKKGHVEVVRLLLECGANVVAQDKNGWTPLHLALQAGQLKVARFLIYRGADVNARDMDQSTPLHLASLWGQLEVAQLLIDHYVDVNARDVYSSTPLHLASRVGQLEIVRLLIDHGAIVGSWENRLTPLHLASREGQLEVAHFLIDHGAEVNARDMYSLTPLHLASREGQLEIARFLIDHGANVGARDTELFTPLHLALREGQLGVACFLIVHGAEVNSCDMYGSTPLYLALRVGQLEVVHFLINHGADVDARDINRSTLLHLASREGQPVVARLLIDHGVDVNAGDMYGSAPLHLAAREGQPEVACILLERGADSDARDNGNCIPLHWTSQLGHLEVARILLEHGTDVNSEDISNWTPLHGASQDGHSKVVHFLLNHGANVHAVDLGGWTSLQLASRRGDLETVLLLLAHGADANTRDNSNWTPLHCASRWGHRNVVYVLLRYGADANAQDNNNWTPLHCASQRAHPGVVRDLVGYHADVNARGDGNQTPLHLASRAGYLGIVELLVESRADIHVRNDEGRTPFDEASVKGHRDIMQLLLQHGAKNDGV